MFVPNKENCTVLIRPEGETEKAYKVWSGSNGSIVNPRSYYEFVGKSICYVEDGKIYAPEWATRSIPLSEKEYQ